MTAQPSLSPALTIVSIKVSQGCEMARWLLQRAHLPFVEHFQAPLLHIIATRAAGGGNEAPVLVVHQSDASASGWGVKTVRWPLDAVQRCGRVGNAPVSGHESGFQTIVADLR